MNPAIRQSPINLTRKSAARVTPYSEMLQPQGAAIDGEHLDGDPLAGVISRPLRKYQQVVEKSCSFEPIQ
jgi:hypothetical protein